MFDNLYSNKRTCFQHTCSQKQHYSRHLIFDGVLNTLLQIFIKPAIYATRKIQSKNKIHDNYNMKPELVNE